MLTKYVAAPNFHDKLLQVGMKRAMAKIYRLSGLVVLQLTQLDADQPLQGLVP